MICVFIFGLFVIIASSENPSECPAILHEDVQYFDVRLTRQNVPPDRTFYVGQQIQVPLDGDHDYHMVAFEPLISNLKVMHHMLLFGCRDHTPSLDAHKWSDTDNSMCPIGLTVWTLGQTGTTCLHGDAGVRFGKSSLRTLALQIHWNNADGRTDLFDNSGFRIYYTSKLRRFDMGIVQIGQNDIEIPARSSQSLVRGSCSETCTRRILPYSVYLTRTSLHMHHLGVRAHFGVYRNGTLVETVANDDNFAYSSSSIHVNRPGVEVRPGDEVRLECWYTNHDNRAVYWDEGAKGEMCYAFVSYYPEVPGFAQCVQFDSYDTCLPNASDPTQIGPCHVAAFNRQSDAFLDEVVNSCYDGRTLCDEVCGHAISSLTSHECMQGRIGRYLTRELLSKKKMWSQVEQIIAAATLC